jgi:hypothetical protein
MTIQTCAADAEWPHTNPANVHQVSRGRRPPRLPDPGESSLHRLEKKIETKEDSVLPERGFLL